MAAFRPTKKDERKLSVSSSAKFDAESAYKQHAAQGLQSGGSVAITEREVAAAYSVLDVRDDGSVIPLGAVVRDDNPFEGHSHVDFSDLHRRECKSVAANLSNASNDRGWLYQPHRTGISSES